MINICLYKCCTDSISSLWIGLVTGLFTGLMSGLYASLIVTRYAKFADLQNKALNAIRNIDFMFKGDKFGISGDSEVNKLLNNICGDLIGLNHREAGKSLGSLAKEITDINIKANSGQLKSEDYKQYYADWQSKCRSIQPNLFVILSLKIKL
jgi:hypothetical protein